MTFELERQCCCWLTLRVWWLQFDLIQENLKYFLEIMQNKKSDLLEWTIIVLIAGEIAVSVYDMWSRGVLTFV
jgi:uncharacterized Rmd1/YagE family protein